MQNGMKLKSVSLWRDSMQKQNDYEILGLAPGASQDEIKRAYFKLVRKFSPEKEPERFQEIRGAYERLMQVLDVEDEVELEMPDNPNAKAICNNIVTLMHKRDYKKALSMAERAINIFGEFEIFLYMLACSQRLSGHSGKAVKTYEKLVKQYPNHNIHKRGLALAYYDRGFGKKALTAFEDAYKLGVKDNDFILQFSACCRDREKFNRGVEILLELAKSFDNTPKTRENLEDYMEAYVGLFSMNFLAKQSHFEEIAKLYIEFIKSTGRLLKKHDESVFDIIFVLVMTVEDSKDMDYVEEILKEIEKMFPKEKYPDEWEGISDKLAESKIGTDSRLSIEFQWCWEAFISARGLIDKALMRFAQTDCKLLIIERMPEIKKEIDIVKNEYPQLYKEMKDFFEQLEREDISYIREKLLKDYDRVEKYIEGGHYYEFYPHRRREVEKLQWNSGEDGSFVRSEKKVGRNDPCPCGSGKKYKQCCGRNK